MASRSLRSTRNGGYSRRRWFSPSPRKINAVGISAGSWKVEEFHKSLKSNAALAKSPTRTVTTQNNHVFMSIYAVFRLECLKLKLKLNHFALRMKLYVKATQQAYRELQAMRAA